MNQLAIDMPYKIQTNGSEYFAVSRQLWNNFQFRNHNLNQLHVIWLTRLWFLCCIERKKLFLNLNCWENRWGTNRKQFAQRFWEALWLEDRLWDLCATPQQKWHVALCSFHSSSWFVLCWVCLSPKSPIPLWIPNHIKWNFIQCSLKL